MFIIENGVQRHTLTKEKLNALYKALEDFEADLTESEYKAIKSEFQTIRATIHARMRDTK